MSIPAEKKLILLGFLRNHGRAVTAHGWHGPRRLRGSTRSQLRLHFAGDGLPNYLDTDSDGDGASDAMEVAWGTDPYDANDTPMVPLARWPAVLVLLAAGAMAAWALNRGERHAASC